MRINEKGTNMEITSRIKDYLFKKLEHAEKFIASDDTSALCDVELGKTTKHHKGGDIFRTEINLQVAGKNFRAVAEEEDLFASIDIAQAEIIAELKKNKDKQVTAVKRGGAKIKSITRGQNEENN
jgi:ribosomal subunit interface protein